MARISLCMIVRDEEQFIEGCLASARAAVDEIIVVDTGSRDRTPEICRRFGARVVPFAWCDDFAAARNEALRFATGEWILQLDADERLAPGGARVLRAAARDLRVNGALLRLHNASRLDAPTKDVLSGAARIGEPVWLLRFVRRLPDTAWENAIHETLGPWLARNGAQAMRLDDADLVHLGAIYAVRADRGKQERNLQLLRRRVERAPEDVAAYGYLAMDSLNAGRLDEARDAADRGWAVVERKPGWHPLLRLAVAGAMLRLASEPARAVEILTQAEARYGAHPDMDLVRATALEHVAARQPDLATRRALLEEAADLARRAIAAKDKVLLDAALGGSTGFGSKRRLGGVLLALGRPAEAEGPLREVASELPGDPETELGLCEVLLEAGDPLAALTRLEKQLGAAPDGWVLAGEAARRLGANADALVLARRGLDATARATFIAPHRRDRLIALLRALGLNAAAG